MDAIRVSSIIIRAGTSFLFEIKPEDYSFPNYSNRFGLFGGHSEDNEGGFETLKRELNEEILNKEFVDEILSKSKFFSKFKVISPKNLNGKTDSV
ncbi:MAG: hypothetical protein GOV01_01755, partial [Candidatus Altiarchaeota archaeon]|nr:hypothetical protein [Candidatus Altiarchaeota archaeon]